MGKRYFIRCFRRSHGTFNFCLCLIGCFIPINRSWEIAIVPKMEAVNAMLLKGYVKYGYRRIRNEMCSNRRFHITSVRIDVTRTMLSMANNTMSMWLNTVDFSFLFDKMKIEIRFKIIPINAIEHDSTPFIQKSNGSGDIVKFGDKYLMTVMNVFSKYF